MRRALLVAAAWMTLAMTCAHAASAQTSTAPKAATIAQAEDDETADGAAASNDGPPRVDLNHASQSELESLPGIGPSRAAAILAFRDGHGGFRSVSQLLKIKGIGRATLRRLRPLVSVGGVGTGNER